MRNQLQLLIDRPENQRKFAEIEARLAAKGLISQQQLLNNNHHQAKPIRTNQITSNKAEFASSSKPPKHSSTQLIYSQHNQNGSVNRSKRNNTLTSDGRSAEDEYNQSDGYSPTIRSEPDGQPSSNKSLAESKSSSGNSSGSSPPPQSAPNPVVVEMYENLAAELKAKLGNPSIGPILLPPKDYDTVCRSQGRLVELDKRACTNSLVVGVGKSKKAKESEKQTKKPDNLILNTNEKAANGKESVSPKETLSKDAAKDALKEVPKVATKDAKPDAKAESKTKEIIASKKRIDPAVEQRSADKLPDKVLDKSLDKSLEANKLKQLSPDELKEQKKRLDHQQIREQQKQYEAKLKNLQRKQELYEQQQLLIEQQKQVRRELSQQHKLASKAKEQIKKIDERQSAKQQVNANAETSAVIHTGGIKQIGSSLANKIKQSLIGSNKEKLQPQLICHKTIHDSLQSLNKLTKSDLLLSSDKLKSKTNNLKPIDNLIKASNYTRPAKDRGSANGSNAKSSTLNTSMSNSSSNLSRDLNEKLNTMNSRSDSSNVSKSISSGIGSGANLTTKKNGATNYDDPPYLSTDEELEDEMLIHEMSADEYALPDFAFRQYLNDDEDEIIDDLDEEEPDNQRVVRRMVIREKLLLLEKNASQEKKKSEFGSTGERQVTSSEDDAEIGSICYDENLVITKINTARRIKKPSTKSIKLDQFNQKIVDNVKNAKNLAKHHSSPHVSSAGKAETKSAGGHSAKLPTKSTAQPGQQVKRSETYYEMNAGQKQMFHNNYYFPSTNKSPIDRSAMHQPKLFYFPNPEFKAAQQQLHSSPAKQQPQLMKYHLGRQQQAAIRQCELRRQKSTPNVNAKFNYHPMLINGQMNSSVEKMMIAGEDHLINRKIEKYGVAPVNLVHQRPISMVNVMQPEHHFRMPPHQPADFKRVPIYY